MSFQFKVTKEYSRGPETACAAFTDYKDAETFIKQLKLPEDALLKVAVTYRIHQGAVLLEEFNQSHLTQQGQGSQGQGNTASFNPSPFATSPRPPGMPASNWVDDEDKK
jgi:hypothetical protein